MTPSPTNNPGWIRGLDHDAIMLRTAAKKASSPWKRPSAARQG